MTLEPVRKLLVPAMNTLRHARNELRLSASQWTGAHAGHSLQDCLLSLCVPTAVCLSHYNTYPGTRWVERSPSSVLTANLQTRNSATLT